MLSFQIAKPKELLMQTERHDAIAAKTVFTLPGGKLSAASQVAILVRLLELASLAPSDHTCRTRSASRVLPVARSVLRALLVRLAIHTTSRL